MCPTTISIISISTNSRPICIKQFLRYTLWRGIRFSAFTSSEISNTSITLKMHGNISRRKTYHSDTSNRVYKICEVGNCSQPPLSVKPFAFYTLYKIQLIYCFTSIFNILLPLNISSLLAFFNPF